EPVVASLENYQPPQGADLQPIIDIAWNQGVHPRKGFDFVLEYQGICPAITLFGGSEAALPPDARDYCASRLVRALHEQLTERLRIAIREREGKSATGTLPEMFANREWLFDDDQYHIDVSHLFAVVQFSLNLPAGVELSLARDLCAFGERLPERYRHRGD